MTDGIHSKSLHPFTKLMEPLPKTKPVMEKFSFQPQLFTEGVLVLTDTSDTEVDSDIFDELVKGVQAFKVGYRKQPATDF
ncbi:hypothetical protein CHARACLAT_020212 [Characodon lateralis]|uniref:Uncharacterized protein n=1 Tax=Characodon lateralis TaxID=208331 RepID=A0ABU7EB98_9TELE|nr:hypothetical protein [Characodon lateralis]